MSVAQPQRVVVINDRSEMIGGASNLSILSARFLERNGIDVTFFSGDHPTSPAPVANTINLAGKPLTQQSRLSALANGLYNGGAYAALREIVREDTPSTIYHVHGWSKILSPSIFRALAPVRERVILHAHDYFLACPNGGFANYRTHKICTLTPMSAQCLTTQCDKRGYHEKLWRSLRHGIRGKLFDIGSAPANIVVVHERMRDYFIKAGINSNRIRAIRNPVEPLLLSHNSPWEKRPFFFIGRLEPEKGFADAAAAARAAGVALHVIGDGAGRALLEKEFPEVFIHGWQGRDAIRRIIADARAVVVSSRVPEPFSLAAVEAVASGIPVIVPREALIGAEIAELDCGLTFRSGDIQSLIQAMRQMGEDDALIRRMSANCVREGRALAHNSESWGEALLSLYGEVLEQSAGASRDTGRSAPARIAPAPEAAQRQTSY